jgi:hypothetical protein
MSRSPATARWRGPSSGSRSPPERVEENAGRTALAYRRRALVMVTGRAHLAGRPILRPSASPPHGGRVPVLASHPDAPARWTHRKGRPIDRSHAGSPQGFLTRRILPSSRCVWLTNAIDRIVKESDPTTVLRSSTELGSQGVVGFLSRSCHSTPSAGVRCLSATHPGRLQRSVSFARQEQ